MAKIREIYSQNSRDFDNLRDLVINTIPDYTMAANRRHSKYMCVTESIANRSLTTGSVTYLTGLLFKLTVPVISMKFLENIFNEQKRGM